MSGHQHGKKPRESGPQGTRVFSDHEVGQMLENVSADPEESRVQLVGRTAPVDGRVIALTDTRVVFGRSDSSDVQIDEPSVSNEHARIVREGGSWRVVNLLSTNGTFVNDRRVRNQVLSDGDVVRLGRVELVFRDPEGQSAPPEPEGRSFRSLVLPLGVGIAAVVMVLALVGLYRLV